MVFDRSNVPWLVFAVVVSSCEGDASSPSPSTWQDPPAPLRSRTALDGTWQFAPAGYPARPVTVPCFWEAIPAEGYDLACPGYLDGTPDEGLTITEGGGWERRTIHEGTYTVEFEVDGPGSVVRISFEALHHQATVRVNDVEVGSHIGAYHQVAFDVSAAAGPGRNTLTVELTDGSALLGDDGFPDWPVGYYSHTDITGIYRSVSLETLPALRVDDTFIVPSVRRGDLTLEHTLVNGTSRERRVWVQSRVVGQDGQVALSTEPRRVSVPAQTTVDVVVVEAFPEAVLWSPAQPYLYTLRTLVTDDDSGDPLDLREDRFGFREVWIEDGDYRLNGERMNLLGDSVDDQASRPRYWGPRYLSCDQARETLTRIKELNINAVRFHQAPPADCVYDLADELGLLVISESPLFARLDIVPPFNNDETYVENGRRWLEAWVRRQRNHPSIVLWSVENELLLYFLALTPEQLLTLADPVRGADTIVRPDGVATTPRPVSWDGDSAFLFREGYDVETVNHHYPYGDWETIEPSQEWFEDALANYERYLVEDVPCGVGETVGHRPHELPEGRSYDQIKAMEGIAVRAMRILGFDDIRPYKLNWAWHFFYPDGSEHPFAPYYHSLYSVDERERLVRFLRESYHPIAVFDEEYTRHAPNLDGTIGPLPLPSATAIERTLVVCNDSFSAEGPETVTWSVVDETDGAVLAGETFEVVVPNGLNETAGISFVTPSVADGDQPRTLTLNLSSELSGLPQGTYEATYAFTVEPGNGTGR